VGRFALYRDEPRPAPRAEVVLEPGHLALHMPGGAVRTIALDGAAVMTADAASRRRFVRMLIVDANPDRPANGAARLVATTPPELGAIAPRAIRLPDAPPDAAVVDTEAFDALVDWLMGGGRLAGYSVAELARISRIASPQFAALIGEVAAQIAVEMVWEAAGPWRGGVELEHALRPLVEASRTSVRAAEALVAALSIATVLRPRRRRAG
jgi:hypothetical protein